jgi:hypothetical protein
MLEVPLESPIDRGIRRAPLLVENPPRIPVDLLARESIHDPGEFAPKEP